MLTIGELGWRYIYIHNYIYIHIYVFTIYICLFVLFLQLSCILEIISIYTILELSLVFWTCQFPLEACSVGYRSWYFSPSGTCLLHSPEKLIKIFRTKTKQGLWICTYAYPGYALTFPIKTRDSQPWHCWCCVLEDSWLQGCCSVHFWNV